MSMRRPSITVESTVPWLFVRAETSFGLIRGLVADDMVGYSSAKAGTMEEFLGWGHRWLGNTAKIIINERNTPLQQAFQTDVDRLLQGQPSHFQADLSRNTPFQIQVARAVQQIPFGTTASYGDIAVAIGKPGGAQAVGQALPRLPFALFIPSHRVVRTTGIPIGCTLLTFELKTDMLQWEREQALNNQHRQ